MSSFECEPLRSKLPDSFDDVWGVTVGRIRINNPLEHDGVLIEWQLDMPTQCLTSSRRVLCLLQIENHAIVRGEFVHGARDHKRQCGIFIVRLSRLGIEGESR